MVGHLGDPRLIGAVALGAVLFTFVQWAFSFLRMGNTGFIALTHGARDFTEVNAAAIRAIGCRTRGRRGFVGAKRTNCADRL